MAPGPLTICETPEAAAKPWPAGLRMGFRFSFAYVALYCLSNQIFSSIFPIPKVNQPDLSTLEPVRGWIFWVAQHVFHIMTPLVYTDSGSGDKTFDWVLDGCILAVSVFVAAVWSLVDLKRKSYPRLANWLRLMLRLALGSQMLVYGLFKAIPIQMPYPYLFRFLEPLRNYSPMGVLWTSVGASPAYEFCAGCAELAGGILLMFPRTVVLGALVCLADMIQVFTLNMTYDVPVKLHSFHLILFSLLLLGPNLRQLSLFFFKNQPAALEPQQPLFRSRRLNRVAGGLLAFLWLWMIGNDAHVAWGAWHQYGPGSEKPALYGIWNIEQMTVDGTDQPLDANHKDEWRRLVFDFADSARVQLMDDSQVRYDAATDAGKKTVALKERDDQKWQASFTYTQPAAGELVLDGTANGHKEHIGLRLMDRAQFPLVSRGFHWVQEYPYNR
jgi:uncharacterized membrane protein YphA (DoxX/SURF4 family)